GESFARFNTKAEQALIWSMAVAELSSYHNGALPGGCVENALSQTQRFRRHFHIFVDVDVFNRAFQTHAKRRFELNPFAFALASHVGEMFCFAGIDWQILRSRVFADDHSRIDVFLRADEKPPAFLNVVERVSCAYARFHRDHHTTTASSD